MEGVRLPDLPVTSVSRITRVDAIEFLVQEYMGPAYACTSPSPSPSSVGGDLGGARERDSYKQQHG